MNSVAALRDCQVLQRLIPWNGGNKKMDNVIVSHKLTVTTQILQDNAEYCTCGKDL